MSRDSSSKAVKGFGHPLSVIVTTIGIFLASQLVAAILTLIALVLLHSGQSPEDLLNNSTAGQFFVVLISEGLAACSVIWLVRRRGMDLSRIGMGRRPVFDDFWRALIGFVVFWGFLIIINILLGLLAPHLDTNQKQDLGFNSLNSMGDKTLAFLALVILPPLGEEPLVRGYLYSGLRDRWKFLPAMIMTSLIFGIAHLELGSGNPLVWGAALNTFVLSVVLVYLRERTGALYAGGLVHMLNNLVAFIIYLH